MGSGASTVAVPTMDVPMSPASGTRREAPAGPAADSSGSGSGGAGGCVGCSDGSSGAPALGLQDLPDELLGHVFVLAERTEGPSLTAVCRRFRRLFWSQAPLWDAIQVAAGDDVAALGSADLALWCEQHAGRLQRVAGMVEQVSIESGMPAPAADQGNGGAEGEDGVEVVGQQGEPLAEHQGRPGPAQYVRLAGRLAGLLGSLRGSGVRYLEMLAWGLPLSKADCLALSELTALETLNLSNPDITMFPKEGRCELPAGSGEATLCPLTSLQGLLLSVQRLPPDWLASLCQLAGLDTVVLYSVEPLPAGGLYCLSALPRLSKLSVHELSSRPEGLRLFGPGFESVNEMQMCSTGFQVPASTEGPGPAPGVLRGFVEAGSETPVGLECYKCACCDNQEAYTRGVCQQRSPGMLGLLRAAGAAGGRLNKLGLAKCSLTKEAWAPPEHGGGDGGDEAEQQAAALLCVRNLVLEDCWPADEEEGGGGMAAVLRAALPQLPQLCHLRIRRCLLGPAGPLGVALSAGPRITSLLLGNCGLRELPEGAYLEELEHLDLSDNRLRSVPPALAQATTLRTLALGGNVELALTGRDVTLLTGLPRLERLELWGTAVYGAQVAEIKEGAPGLEVALEPPTAAAASAAAQE